MCYHRHSEGRLSSTLLNTALFIEKPRLNSAFLILMPCWRESWKISLGDPLNCPLYVIVESPESWFCPDPAVSAEDHSGGGRCLSPCYRLDKGLLVPAWTPPPWAAHCWDGSLSCCSLACMIGFRLRRKAVTLKGDEGHRTWSTVLSAQWELWLEVLPVLEEQLYKNGAQL